MFVSRAFRASGVSLRKYSFSGFPALNGVLIEELESRHDDLLDVGAEVELLSREDRREGGMTACADVQAARFVGLVMDVGEVRDGLIAADGAADALEDPVCAATRAPELLDVPVERRVGHARDQSL